MEYVKSHINKEGYFSSPFIHDATIEVIISTEIDSKISTIEEGKAWKYIDKDHVEYVDILTESMLKYRRKKECFDIIDNRSKFWYDSLSEEHLSELREWYQAWLDVTETKTIPVKPEWIK